MKHFPPSPAKRPPPPRFALSLLLLALLSVETVLAQQQTARFEVFEATIPRLQQALTRGETTSEQLVAAYLERISAYEYGDAGLNAVLAVNPFALEEARELDRERARSGSRGPMHGIPVLVKDNFDVAGMATTGGSVALARHAPAEDAFQVRRLRDAGAIILAKTNLHELAYGITTISSAGGQTRNPYDPQRNPGGSSGGTGAGVAASLGAVGWGSDTCGSIRIPAAVHSLFGLRPTKGLSSIDGILPLASTQDVGGPLARTSVDLAISLDATIGPDPRDPATATLQGRTLPRFFDSLDPDALRGARIGVLLDYFGGSPAEREVNSVVREALTRMAGLGAEVVEVSFPGLGSVLAGTSLIELEFKWDLEDYLARTPEAPVGSLGQIVESGLHHPEVGERLRRAARHETRPSPGYAEALERRQAATTALLALMDDHGLDALAYPTLRREPAVIGEPALGSNCQLSAATGTPALSIPAGFTRAGLPTGLELLGRPFGDARLVAFGYAYESAFSPRLPPALTPPLPGR
jgi:amidase